MRIKMSSHGFAELKSTLASLGTAFLLLSTPAIASDALARIDLNTAEPAITETCWLDLVEGEGTTKHRIDIALYGQVVPITTNNFIALSKNDNGIGYR